jgi:glycosyltransferase involved in cell wall biosynthesis
MCEQTAKESNEIFCLNSEFSTTRMVTRQEPVIENHSEDQFETKLFLPEGESRQGEGGLRTQGYFKKSLTDKPLISVITVVFNGEKYLEETIQSVTNQTYDNVEYIIVDGRSTDDTLDIIQKYKHAIDYWVSEKDKGIYNAMNKGIELCSGEIIGIINSDDYYAKDALEYVVNVYKKTNKPCVIYGNLIKIDDKNSRAFFQGDMTSSAFRNAIEQINHPTCFVDRSLYLMFGNFDEYFEMGADRELFFRFYNYNVNFEYIPKVIAFFRLGGVTSQINIVKSIRRLKQIFLIYKTHGISYNKIIFKLSKKILRNTLKILLLKLLTQQDANTVRILWISIKNKLYNKIHKIT